MREILRTVTAVLMAWLACVAKTGRKVLCFFLQVGRFLAGKRPNKLESVFFVLALSMIAAGVFFPGQSSVIIDTLWTW